MKIIRRPSKSRLSSIITRPIRTLESASTYSEPKKTPERPQAKRSPPALDGWTTLEHKTPDTFEGLNDSLINRLLEIEHCPCYKTKKRLATKLFYALYGKPEDLRAYYAGGPAIEGVDINGKPYAF